MEVNKTSSSQGTSSNVTAKNTLDKNAFLKILTVQLSNQDPLNASDNTEYIAQMAQFSSLEQMQNLNDSIGKLVNFNLVNQGTQMIGKQVQIQLDDSSTITAKVSSVLFDSGLVYVNTDKGKYDINSVFEVGEVTNDQQSNG